jgi:hypothetical protein
MLDFRKGCTTEGIMKAGLRIKKVRKSWMEEGDRGKTRDSTMISHLAHTVSEKRRL